MVALAHRPDINGISQDVYPSSEWISRAERRNEWTRSPREVGLAENINGGLAFLLLPYSGPRGGFFILQNSHSKVLPGSSFLQGQALSKVSHILPITHEGYTCRRLESGPCA